MYSETTSLKMQKFGEIIHQSRTEIEAMLVCVCMRVRVCVCVCVQVYTCGRAVCVLMHMSMWRPAVNHGYCFSGLVCLVFEE